MRGMMTVQLTVVRGDITRQVVDAIVNAANTRLAGGGGVDGAIHRAAGPQLSAACRALGGCATGQAVITPGFQLPARYIIHTPGPRWQGGGQGEDALLASSYRSCLAVALHYAVETIAFPAISAGVYGFPAARAARIAVMTVKEFLGQHPGVFREVRFVCFQEEMAELYNELITAEQANAQ